MATGMLIDGKWSVNAYSQDKQGRFERQPTVFRNHISSKGDFLPESGRYHLYVSLACPWAHRTLIMRRLKGLEDAISLSIVDPIMGDDGWKFSEAPGAISDSVNHAQFLRDIYILANSQYTGRVTVPILWDKHKKTIVNNESREVMRMFDLEFEAHATNNISFYPQPLRAKIDHTIDAIYQPINNGVYRAGFAKSQKAYEEAIAQLFEALNHWDAVLKDQKYLCGDQITEADWCLFTTLIRFDEVYYVHFKCNVKHIYEYSHLWNYLKSLYNYPGVKDTCNFHHIKQHYYSSHPWINPTGLIPVGPNIAAMLSDPKC